MESVIHLIDAHAPLEAISQLRLLAEPQQRVLCLPPAPAAMETMPLTQVRPLLGLRFLAAQQAGRMARDARVVHAWSVPAAAAMLRPARRAGLRLLLSLTQSPTGNEARFITRALRQGRLAVTTESEHLRAAIAAHSDAADRVFLLRPAAAPVAPLDDARRADLRDRLGIAPGHRVMAVPGPMGLVGAHRGAILLHLILREVRSDIALLMPGDGTLRGQIRTQLSKLGYDAHAVVPGPGVPVPEALAIADVAVVLLPPRAGLHPLAMALGAGLPIVAYRTPAAQELLAVQGRLAARLVDRNAASPREACREVLEILEDDGLVGDLRARATEQAKRLSPQRIGERLGEIYTQIQ